MIEPFGNKYQDRVAMGKTGAECCICGKQIKGESLYIVVDHTTGKIVDKESENTSGYPIGPDCANKVRAQRKGSVIIS